MEFQNFIKRKFMLNEALVMVDILFTLDEKQNSATCYHSDSILSCIVDSSSQAASNLVTIINNKKIWFYKMEKYKKI